MKKTAKLISILLVAAMLLSLVPLSLTAFSASVPSYSASGDGVRIYANGTNLFIEAGTSSGTAVYYNNNGNKVYLNPNGAKGDDLSVSEIFAGTNSINADNFDVSIVMTGGSVGTIYTGKVYGYLMGKVTVAVTGSAQVGLLAAGSKTGPGNGIDHHTGGSLAIYDTVGVSVQSGVTNVDGMIKKTSTGWDVSGSAVVPNGVTMTIGSDQTVTVPTGASVKNYGAIVNNGTLELYGSVTGNNITGNGTINCYTAYIENVSSVSSVSAKANGNAVVLENGQYRLSGGNLYIWLPNGNAEVILNSTKYYGITVSGQRIKLTTSYVGVNSISGIPSELTANISEKLAPVTNATTFAPAFSYEIVESGTTASGAKILNGSSVIASGEGTINLKVTASDGYSTYSNTFKITVKNVGHAASIANGDITISKHSDTQLKITHAGFEDGSIIIDNDEYFMITGTSGTDLNYGITVGSGATANILLKDCSITRNGQSRPAISISSGASVNLRLAGENTFSNQGQIGGDGVINAGIYVPSGASLVIDGEGSLTVNAGVWSAGIGGSYNVSVGTITINGGTITVTGGRMSAGIGGGYKSNGGMLIINGGTITSNRGEYNSVGIGNGYNGSGVTVTINGGNIKATAQTSTVISGTPKDAAGNAVSLMKITLDSAAADTAVTATEGINYGINNVKTLDTNILYFYLPADTAPTSITAGGKEYICNRNGTYYTTHGETGYINITEDAHDVICSECETVLNTGKTHVYDADYKCVCGHIKHTHSFTYSASGDTITATCSNENGKCPDTNGGTFRISAPADLYADGTTAKEAVIDNQLADTSVTYEVVYTDANGATSNKAPTTAGSYTASVTVGGATATVQFELVKRSAAANNFIYTAPENLVYDGTPKYATVEASPETTGMGEITVSYYQNGEAVEPINAGTYTVKVSTAETDKYYAINDVELGTFTINTKDISDAFIILGDALTYNGKEQTQTVEKVLATGIAPEVTYTVSGNTATNVGVYLLTVTGTGNFSGEAKIAYEIAVDMNGVDFEQLHWGNVKSTDKERIEYIYNQVDNAVTDLASDEKKAEWNNLRSTCVELLKMIESVTDHLESYKEEVAGYDIDTVTSDDYDYLERLSESEGQWLYDHSENYTEEEIVEFSQVNAALTKLLIRISDVAKEITRITNAVNGYDESTVKYNDYTDILQLIDDIEALTDGQNITDDERASLEELNTKANLLAAKIRSTVDEIARITKAVNAYNIDTVKSSDKTDIEKLIARIKKLTDGDNITDAEREQLAANDETLDALLAKINATADEIERIEEAVNGYDAETVKSSDKADIEQLKADIKELTDGQNITAEEREYLVNADAECDKLLAKIAETKSEYDRVIATANGYDEATVTSADKDDLIQLDTDIFALALTNNVTSKEKTSLMFAHSNVFVCIQKITYISEEIKRIVAELEKYVFESVKSSDKADIQQIIADIKALLDTQNITADERTLLENADETCDKLIAKIDETVAEINRINDARNTYDIDTVTSADKEAVEKLIADIKALTDGDNITVDERKQLEDNEATLNALLEKIGATADEIARIEDAVNSYDEATVKSTDKADIEKLIEDVKALTDATNITEDERTKLGELDATLDSLIKKIDDTAAEIARIDEVVNAYDEETVKSSDIPALGKLIDDIKALTDGDNITEEEKAALEADDATVDALVEKLAEVAEEIKRVDEAVKSYDEETVKSSDKADLEQLKEDVQALIDSTNTTENEKTALEEMIKDIEALEGRIEETEQQLEKISGIENGYTPEDVTSDDKAAIEDAIAEIEAVNPDNLTDEQKAEYEELKAEFEALLAEIATAEKAVDDIGIELEMFDEKRVTIFWEDDIEALKAKIDELLADENMGEAEKAKLNEYKAQADNLIEIINDPCEYFSCRLFYFIWDCLTWKYNGILYLFKLIFAC